MNPAQTPMPSPTPLPPPPPPTPPAAARQHSTRRVIAAAVIGIALGIGVVGVLAPASVEVPATTAPAAVAPEVPTSPAPAADAAAAQTPGTVPSSTVIDQATAEQVALAHLGEGQVTWVTPEDDRGAAWEVEVTLPSGREVDVLVDANGQVVRTTQGLARLLP